MSGERGLGQIRRVHSPLFDTTEVEKGDILPAAFLDVVVGTPTTYYCSISFDRLDPQQSIAIEVLSTNRVPNKEHHHIENTRHRSALRR